jgi:hypothetical protein
VGEAIVPDIAIAGSRVFFTRVSGILGFQIISTSCSRALHRYGTFVFNNLVSPPPCIPGPTPFIESDTEEAEGLLSSPILEETAALPANLGQSGFDVLPEGEHAQAQAKAAAAIR